MARQHTLDDELVRTQFVDLYHAGASRATLANEFDTTERTISNWLRHPAVQAELAQKRAARVNRITRKVDAAIEAKLESAEKMDPELLLKIRKEYVPTQIEVGAPGSAEAAAAAAWDLLDAGGELPELVESTAEEVPGE